MADRYDFHDPPGIIDGVQDAIVTNAHPVLVHAAQLLTSPWARVFLESKNGRCDPVEHIVQKAIHLLLSGTLDGDSVCSHYGRFSLR